MKSIIMLLTLSHASAVFAYIGPGLGAGVIATVVALIGAGLLALVGLVYFPVKRFLKRRKHQAFQNDVSKN